RALALAANSKLPRILHFTSRRVAAIGTPAAFAEITRILDSVPDDASRLDILNGVTVALEGQPQAPSPPGWNSLETKLSRSPNPAVRARAQSLSLRFGSSTALTALRETLMERSADAETRKTALESLLAA